LYVPDDTCNVYLIRDGDSWRADRLRLGAILDHLGELEITTIDWIFTRIIIATGPTYAASVTGARSTKKVWGADDVAAQCRTAANRVSCVDQCTW
jgi:hypothetical protein